MTLIPVKNKNFRLPFLYLFLLFQFSCTQTSEVLKRPNVVVVLIDNQGYHELSRNGHAIVNTPRIDLLSQEAVNFTEFYAPPFCSPSRSEMLTGRYALRAGVHNTIGGVSILHKNEKTIADILKSEGYHTSIFGKWHLGSSYPYAPKYRGFQEVFIHGGGGVSQLGDYYGNDHIDATYEHNGTFVKSKGFSTDVLFDRAIDFMDDKKNDENPFFCFISTPAVHFPTNLHPETTKRLLARGAENDKFLPLYSMIENVDDNVGKLLDYLNESNLKENTLLIVASDQGVNDRGAIKHRSGKFQNRGLSFDEKHHVYCMIQYPILTNTLPGDNENLTGMIDITPTILDICGISGVENIDGQSLKPLLSNTKGWNDERKLVIQCPRARNRNKWKNSSVKYKKWRLVDGKELYNIENDFGQLNNLAEKKPDLVLSLEREYESFWNSLAPENELLSVHILGSEEAPKVRLNGMDWYVGDAPWTQQGMVKKSSQGKWKVEIARNGTYKFELRRFPREAPTPIGADSAIVEIGNITQKKSLDINSPEVFIEMDLPKGVYDMQTFFIPPIDSIEQKSWGANFVHVSFLD